MDYKNIEPGVFFSPIDERDYTPDKLGLGLDVLCAAAPLPDDFSLEYPGKAKYQFLVRSCLAHAISYRKEIEYYLKNGVFKYFSVGFPYANRSTTDYQGGGLVFRQAVDHEVNDGNVFNEDFDYNEEYPAILDIFNPVKDELMKKAAENKNDKSYISLSVANFDEIRAFIYKYKRPVIIAISMYESFNETGSDGIVPLKSGRFIGGHGMCVVGWKRDDSAPFGFRLKVLNSFSEEWGENGYGYIADCVTECYGTLPIEDIPVMPIPELKTYYRVQVYAFKNRDNANNAVSKLASQGINACLVYDNGYFKIQCGCFASLENRDIMVNKLKELGYNPYIITFQK